MPPISPVHGNTRWPSAYSHFAVIMTSDRCSSDIPSPLVLRRFLPSGSVGVRKLAESGRTGGRERAAPHGSETFIPARRWTIPQDLSRPRRPSGPAPLALHSGRSQAKDRGRETRRLLELNTDDQLVCQCRFGLTPLALHHCPTRCPQSVPGSANACRAFPRRRIRSGLPCQLPGPPRGRWNQHRSGDLSRRPLLCNGH